MSLGIIALGAFWVAAIKLWILDGPKIPLTFIAIWLVALIVVPRLHWPGAVLLVLECLMAAILFLIDRYKSQL